MKRSYIYTLIFILLSGFSNLIAQIEEDRIKASLLYYICDYIIWPDIEITDNFNIGVLGNKDVLIDELKLIAPTQKIHDKPLQIFLESNEQELKTDLHALFVAEEFYDQLNYILDFCREKHILLFTDQMGNSVYSVIDFYKNEYDKSINFIVNKQNLILSNLDYKDELLLYGGSLIDVRELYNSIQELLEKESNKVKNLNSQIDIKDKLIISKNEVINTLALTIRNKTKTLENLSDTIELQNKKMEEKQLEMNNQLCIIRSTNFQIEALKKEKYQQTIDINNREKDIRIKSRELAQLDEEIKQNKSQIKIQSQTLENQAEQINLQNRLIILVTTLVLSLLIIGLLLYRTNRISKKNNQILEEQKEELQVTLSKLQNTQNKLIESEKLASIGMLASGVAHEINNPLNYIQGGVYGLETILNNKMYNDSEDIQLILDGIKTGVERAAKIVSSLNYFNRSSDNYDQICNIPQIVDNCLTMLHNKWKHNIRIDRLYTEDSVICIGNEGKLHQSILNILSNSLQAIEDEGIITIDILEKDNLVEISILDNGVGMEVNVLENALEPFFTTKNPGEGTGLGLSITQQIIADHNGNMSISSNSKQGTTVIIQLPKE